MGEIINSNALIALSNGCYLETIIQNLAGALLLCAWKPWIFLKQLPFSFNKVDILLDAKLQVIL